MVYPSYSIKGNLFSGAAIFLMGLIIGAFLFSDNATVTKLRESRENWRSKAEIAQTDLYKSKTEYEQKLQKLNLKHQNEIQTKKMNHAEFNAEQTKEIEKNELYIQDLMTQVSTCQVSVNKLNEEIEWNRSEFSSCEESKEKLIQANQAAMENNKLSETVLQSNLIVCEENTSLLNKLLDGQNALAGTMKHMTSEKMTNQITSEEKHDEIQAVQNIYTPRKEKYDVKIEQKGDNQALLQNNIHSLLPEKNNAKKTEKEQIVEQVNPQEIATEQQDTEFFLEEEQAADVEKEKIPDGGFQPPARVLDNVGFHEENFRKQVKKEHQEHALVMDEFGRAEPAVFKEYASAKDDAGEVIPIVKEIVSEDPPPRMDNKDQRRMGLLKEASASELKSQRHMASEVEAIHMPSEKMSKMIKGKKSKF